MATCRKKKYIAHFALLKDIFHHLGINFVVISEKSALMPSVLFSEYMLSSCEDDTKSLFKLIRVSKTDPP